MMKTKLTLFVAALAASLFGMGCVSTESPQKDIISLLSEEDKPLPLGFNKEELKMFGSKDRAYLKSLLLKAEGGNSKAQHEIVMILRNDTKGKHKQDHEEVIKVFRKWVVKGQASAQEALGLMYQHCLGVKADFVEAFRLARMSAEQNHLGAQNTIGFYYNSGLGVKRNYKKAMQWYLKAMENGGHYDTPLKIGNMYLYGMGVEKNPILAFSWYNITSIQDALDKKAELMKRMKPNQIVEAAKLSEKLLKKYPNATKGIFNN